MILPPHPYSLAISNDGKAAAALQTTNKPNYIVIVKNLDTKKPRTVQIRPDKMILTSGFMGLAFSKDNSLLYVSAGNDGAVAVIDVESMLITNTVNLNGDFSDGSFSDTYTGDIILSPDGKILYAIDQANFRVAAIETPLP